MSGFITDKHLDIAEQYFPGIRAFYAGLTRLPETFIELMWLYTMPPDSRHGGAERGRRSSEG